MSQQRYELLEPIGRGGMATVWRARDRTAQMDVAVKMLHEHLVGDEGFVEAFERETALMCQIDHPGVIDVHALTELDGRPAMVMQLCEGGDLAGRLARRGAFGEQEALAVLDPVLDALAAVHHEGIVHRDVKPGNIVFDADDAPKLIDFGIGQAAELMEAEEAGQVGTVEYMAPELVEGFAVDARSDIYAAGVVLFEMLAGHVPYRGQSPAEVLRMHRNAEVPDVQLFAEGVSERTGEVLQRALAKNPEDRFDEVGRMQSVLRGDHQLAQPVEEHPRYEWLARQIEWENRMRAPVETEGHEWVVITTDATGEHHVDLDAQIEAITAIRDRYRRFYTGAWLEKTTSDPFRGLLSNQGIELSKLDPGTKRKIGEPSLSIQTLSEREIVVGLSRQGAETIADELEQQGGDVRLMRRPRDSTKSRSLLHAAARRLTLTGVIGLAAFGAMYGLTGLRSLLLDDEWSSALVLLSTIWLVAGMFVGAVFAGGRRFMSRRSRPVLDLCDPRNEIAAGVLEPDHIELAGRIHAPQVAACFRRALNMLLHLHDPPDDDLDPVEEPVEPILEALVQMAEHVVMLERQLANTRPVELAAQTRKLDRDIRNSQDPETIQRLMDQKARLRTQLKKRDAARGQLEATAQQLLEVAGRLEELVRRRRGTAPGDGDEVAFSFASRIDEVVEKLGEFDESERIETADVSRK